MRIGEMSLDGSWRRRLLYFHLTVLWAERCSGQIQPFARRMSGQLPHAHLMWPEYGFLRLLE
jgi:hypothetical protein